jgi:4-amino-4-deoxy-L-arabinose transferase-like glycosyltransferase
MCVGGGPPTVRVAPVSTRLRLPSSFAGRLALIVAAGAVARVLYTVLVAPWPPEVSDDQVFYNLQAHLIADGKGFIQPQLELAGTIRPTAAHPPFYPVVLAGLAKLGGGDQLVQRLTGTLFGSVTVIAIGLLARRVAGDRAGLIAAALGAAYPILITADGALMSESLYGMLVALSLLVAYKLWDQPSLGWAALLGVLIGLASLTRGEVFLLLLLLLVPLLLRPRGVPVAAVSIVAMLVVLAPWTIRNYSTFDRFVFVSTNSGAVIGGANCAQVYSGSNIGGWSILCDRPWPGHNEAEETNRQFHDGARYAREHVRRLPIVVAARVGRTVSLFHPWETNSGRSPGVQNAGVVMYFLMVPFAVWGALLLRRRRALLWPLLAPVVMVIVTAAAFYGYLRFRQPAEISLVVLAAVALDALARRASPEPTQAPVSVAA